MIELLVCFLCPKTTIFYYIIYQVHNSHSKHRNGFKNKHNIRYLNSCRYYIQLLMLFIFKNIISDYYYFLPVWTLKKK